MNIKQVQRILMGHFLFFVAATLLMVALYETGVLVPVEEGVSPSLSFVLLWAMELITIVLIPVALKLFSLRAVRRRLAARQGDALLFWGMARIHMLCLPMVANTFLYYQTMAPAFGYMAIILLLCLFFVYPSRERCYDETHPEKD